MSFAKIIWKTRPTLRQLPGAEAYDLAALEAFERGGPLDLLATRTDKGTFAKEWLRLQRAA